MSREEELALFCRWKNGGDDRALHKLVLAYEPLVTSMAYDLHRRGFSVEDAKQEARCGLLEAARRFDPNKGFRFGTYARWWMLSALSTYMIANKDILSSRRMKRKPKVLWSNFVSLDAPITPDGESAAEIIPSDQDGPDLIAEHVIDGQRLQDRLADALNSLEPRERWVVQRRHLDEEAGTLQTVANDMHISAERVRQIEKTALARLRKTLESSKCASSW
jgi:RNA polymerase sigma-32 factor